MQILMVSSQKNWGGGELWMLSAALGLSHRGHQVTLVCQPGSGLAKRAQSQGHRPVTMRLRGDFDPLVVARLYRLIRQRRIQMVCGNMSKEIRLAGLAAKLAGIPVVRRRGSDMPYPNKWRHRLIDAQLVRRIIVNSRATQNTLLRGNPWLAPQKLRLIYNGIPPGPEDGPASREEVLREFGLPGASPLIAIVGLLKDRKGHETLFRALPRVLQEFPQSSVLVVGEGSGREHLEEFARQMGIDRNVRFTGFRDDIFRLMSAMDFLVLPSKNEGFGYVLAEAMSLGKSVVATRASSIPEVVAEGQTGLLVPPGDEDALAQAILELARHPEKARRMGLAGRQRVQERFSLERMLDELEALFAEIISEERLGSDHR